MHDIFDLTGMKAIVTGGGRGLGKGIAEGFLEKGAAVVLIGSSQAALVTAQGFRDHGYQAYGVQADFLSREERASAFKEAIHLLGGSVDILVNVAGIQRRVPAEDFPLENWDEVMEVNLTAVFDMCQRAFPYMKEKGYGKIINIGSVNSFRSVAQNIIAYQSSKAAIAQLCKALADEWSEFGIRTTGIAPGWTMTEMTAAVADDPIKYPSTLKQIPLGRWATPEDYKGIAILLASHAGDYINGVLIPVDGGFLAR